MSPLPGFFLTNPVTRSFHINDGFNAPRNYTFAPNKKQLHEGVDVTAIDAQGQPVTVLAAQRGLVDKVAFAPQGYGNYVRIVHDWDGERWVTWYGHMSATAVQEGQFVLAGQKIGIAGTTGFSTGIHLHVTLQHIGHGLAGYTVDDVVDPEPFFRLDSVPSFDEASFLADVTVPDGTVMQPGQVFNKTWRIRNTGTTAWDAGYKLVFAGGDKMGGQDEMALPGVPVQGGQAINVTLPLTAPTDAGVHRSTWQLRNAAGNSFPNTFYAEIEVKEAKPVDEASYVADVTVEDGTVVQPGSQFTKTWRVRNTGTTTWTTNYSLRFFADEQMGGPDSVPLPRKVKPGEVIELSVSLKAPMTPGRHRSTWKLCNTKGKVFDYEQYGEIQVSQQLAPTEKLDELRFMADVTVPDETSMQPGERFIKTWRVRNTGETTWGSGYTLAFFGDDQMGGPASVPLPRAKPGDIVDVTLMLTAPATPGLHKSTWKGRDPRGAFFEYDLFALVEVVDPNQTYDLLPYLRGDGRLYELQFNWSGGGQQRVQTQVSGDHFYFVKGSEWEELWGDDHFIYRGTDTSVGGGEAYTLTESGQYGSAWVPRQMSIGVPFRRMPLVVFRRKSDGVEIPGKQGVQITWIQLQEVHREFTLSSGIDLADVAILAAYEDANGKPKDQPFERYYYAQKYGLVAWEGSLGQSVMVREFPPGSQPDNQREVLAWST
jgi:hypothetical protein